MGSPIVVGDIPAIEILKLFGLEDPGKCSEVTITFERDDAVRVISKRMAIVDDVEELKTEIKKYKLVPIDD